MKISLRPSACSFLPTRGVSLVPASATTLPEAAPELLEVICRLAGWEFGALWLFDDEAGVLECVGVWHEPDEGLAAFANRFLH